MSAQLSTYWTTVAVTALPPGWINVFENSNDDSGLFFTEACPAVLLQERLADDERETRAVAATFDGADLEPADDNGNHYITVTESHWASAHEDAEREVRADRAQMKQVMLNRLRAAGDAGVEAAALISRFYPSHRALAVRDTLKRDGLVTTAWQSAPDAFQGKEFVYRLAPT